MNATARPFHPRGHPSDGLFLDASFGGSYFDFGLGDHESETGGMSGMPVFRPQFKGRIRSFSEQRGFGFIDCPEALRQFGRDVFIHRFQLAEAGLTVGQECTFEIETNKSGHPQARRVRSPKLADQPTWSVGRAGQSWPSHPDAGLGMQPQCGMPPSSRKGGRDPHFDVGESLVGQYSSESILDMIRACRGSKEMSELVQQCGHYFDKSHVVTALYQLGLCRQVERGAIATELTEALVQRTAIIPPRDLAAEEASRVLWALSILKEVQEHPDAHSFAMRLGQEAVLRYAEFSPSQMAHLVGSLSKFVRTSEEDELVGKVTTLFSDFASGGGNLPKFPAEELRTWTQFLQEVSSLPAAAPAWGQGHPRTEPGVARGMPPLGGTMPQVSPYTGPWPQGLAGARPLVPQGMPPMGMRGPPGPFAAYGVPWGQASAHVPAGVPGKGGKGGVPGDAGQSHQVPSTCTGRPAAQGPDQMPGAGGKGKGQEPS